MNIRKKLAALGILGSLAATCSARAEFDPAATVLPITTFVSGGLTTLVTALLTLSVGALIVGMGIRWARKASK